MVRLPVVVAMLAIVVRHLHPASLLSDGEVLVAGGMNAVFRAECSAEIYDPATHAWSFARNLVQERVSHTATRLDDGSVLVAGGTDFMGPPLASAEVFQP